MKTLDDLIALAQLCPKKENESPVSWVSRARAEGFIDEREWSEANVIIRKNLYLFK